MKEAVVVKHLRKTFNTSKGSIVAVNDVNISIEEGELVGFIGKNGAGKTTTLKCLSGLIVPDSGDIEVLGYIPSDRKYDFLHKISMLMGNRSQLWWELPANETFLLNKNIPDRGYKV